MSRCKIGHKSSQLPESEFNLKKMSKIKKDFHSPIDEDITNVYTLVTTTPPAGGFEGQV